MRADYFFRVMIAMIFAAFLSAGVVTAAEDAPKIQFNKETHDYGQVLYGKTVVEEFHITNTGSAPLVIKKLEATCGCTKILEGPKEVPPHGSSKIVASFDTAGLRAGKKQKSIYVYSNDPVRPMVKLTVYAEVMRDVTLDSQNLAATIPEFQETVSFPMKLSNDSDEPVEITSLTTEPNQWKVAMSPERPVAPPHGSLPITVTVSLKRQPGREYYTGKFNLETSHPHEKTLDVRYLIRLEKPA